MTPPPTPPTPGNRPAGHSAQRVSPILPRVPAPGFRLPLAVAIGCLLGPWRAAGAVEPASDPIPATTAAPSATVPAETAALRATMQEVFEAIAQLLPLSLDDRRFASPEERPRIEGWLLTLDKASRDVERHTGERDPGSVPISHSLARDVADARRLFDRRHYAEAQFDISQLTSTCVACHSRLPKARDFPLAKRFTDRPEVQSLPPAARGLLLVATRQFDAALPLYESRFADPSIRPADLDLDGELLSYLVVSVRVERDAVRPQAALARLAARPDVPRYLMLRLAAWRKQLGEIAGTMSAPPSLAHARELVARGRALSAYPADRIALIYDLAASSELLQLVTARQIGQDSLAEAYFELGGIAARIERGGWIAEIEQDLEIAIRLAPGGPYAEKAYALLEEYTLDTYGGSGGVDVPDEVSARLAELRALLDAARRAPPPKAKG